MESEKPAFTSGPWTVVHEDHYHASDEPTVFVCGKYRVVRNGSRGYDNHGADLADATLGAAAPDMFEALKAIIDQLDDEEMGEAGLSARDWIAHWQRLHDAGTAAISKALGKDAP